MSVSPSLVPVQKRDRRPAGGPLVCAVVVHWRAERDLENLLDAWPHDPRCDLLIVDNSSTAEVENRRGKVYRPARNLGFAGAVNWASHHSDAPWLLILNPDVLPLDDAIGELLLACRRFPEAAGIVPALYSDSGASQAAWQLRHLPQPWQVLAQTLLLDPDLGITPQPAAGTAIEQPAGAALLLNRERLLELDGFDPDFYPAWFEDVDFCKRLASRGLALTYWPHARFRHRLGGSVPRLGYGTFLWIYYRNLVRYLDKHHSRIWRLLARLLLPVGLISRMVFLPLRRPRHAASRWQAAVGLTTALTGALSGWRWPTSLARSWRRGPEVAA